MAGSNANEDRTKTRTLKNQRVRHPKNQPKGWPTRQALRTAAEGHWVLGSRTLAQNLSCLLMPKQVGPRQGGVPGPIFELDLSASLYK